MPSEERENSRIYRALRNQDKHSGIQFAGQSNESGTTGPVEGQEFAIEPVTDSYAAAGAEYVRNEVFGREWKLQGTRVPAWNGAEMLTLIARPVSELRPVAVVTVVETTKEQLLHRRYGVALHNGDRAARYTQLAVLKPYRGLGLPAQLVLEARRQFVASRAIDYTWLLFDADRARSSSFCRHLGFHASSEIYHTEYGRSRVLVRNDGADRPASGKCFFAVGQVSADEWLAQ